jgi:hypothetical protein
VESSSSATPRATTRPQPPIIESSRQAGQPSTSETGVYGSSVASSTMVQPSDIAIRPFPLRYRHAVSYPPTPEEDGENSPETTPGGTRRVRFHEPTERRWSA